MTKDKVLKQYGLDIQEAQQNHTALHAMLEKKIAERQKIEAIDRRAARYTSLATALLFALAITVVKLLL